MSTSPPCSTNAARCSVSKRSTRRPTATRNLLGWTRDFGEVALAGIEGIGSDGAGLTRHLHGEGVKVVEVDRPNRQRRRRRGKSDPQDAITPARAA